MSFFKNKINIDKKRISNLDNPYIIAEISCNHKQKLTKVFKMIDAAKFAGASAIKLQTFTPDSMTLDINKKDFIIQDGLWKDAKLFDLYKEAHLPYEYHKPIFNYARKKKITCFTSVFDIEGFRFLEKNFNLPAYKISSFENNYFNLLDEIIKKNKPIILSTGATEIKEITEIINFFKKRKFKKLILLHCVSAYPANFKDCNLTNINDFKKKFGCLVGFSDHTKGILGSLSAIAQGAVVIEKHFNYPEEKTLDAKFSINFKDLRDLCFQGNLISETIGIKKFKISNSEKKSNKFKRSIYVTKNIKKDTCIDGTNVRIIRPGFSLKPKYYRKIIGRKLNKSKKPGDRISLKDFY